MRIRRLLILAIPLLTFSMMIFGLTGTSAWFVDAGASQVSMITSGTLEMEVSGDPLEGTHLVPGADYSELGAFCSQNAGSTDLKFRGLFEADEASSKDLLEYMTMKVEMETPDGWTIQSEILGDPEEESDALAHYFKFPDQDPEVKNRYMVAGYLTPGQEVCYRFSVRLAPQTPNQLQAKSVDFVLSLQSTQPNNPGWE